MNRITGRSHLIELSIYSDETQKCIRYMRQLGYIVHGFGEFEDLQIRTPEGYWVGVILRKTGHYKFALSEARLAP